MNNNYNQNNHGNINLNEVEKINYNYPSQNNNEVYTTEEKTSLWLKIKVPVIIISALLLIALIIFLIIHISNINKEKNKSEKYIEEYNLLINKTKYFLENNENEKPMALGSCKTFTLKTLIENNLIEEQTNEKINTCDINKTIINVCKLESGNLNYSVEFSCDSPDLKIKYDDLKQGNEIDIARGADVEFTYQATITTINNDKKDDIEEYYDDEIPYEPDEYTKISSKTYYRYRKTIWTWTLTNNYYYPNDEINKDSVIEYYKQTPNANYTQTDSEVTGYKWYVNANEKWNENLSEAPNNVFIIQGDEKETITNASLELPESKEYRQIENNVEIYRKRTLKKTESLTKTEYICSNNISEITQSNPCKLNTNKYTETKQYKCYYDDSKIPVTQDTECEKKYYTYDNWSNWSNEKCNVTDEPILCEKQIGYIYKDKTYEWFSKNEKTYYPSGENQSYKENTYYTKKPIENAIADETTKTQVKKYYKTVVKDLGTSSVPINENAVKGSQSWSEWTEYSPSKPETNQINQIESKERIRISKTIDKNNIDTKNLTSSYVSEQEMIKAVQNAGYEVSNLEDIMNIPNITYKVKMFYRSRIN